MKKPVKTINSLVLTLVVTISVMLMADPVVAFSKTDNQKAMEYAEQQSDGKAIGAKFITKGKKKGYKVRIIKDGKISHLFIALEQLQN